MSNPKKTENLQCECKKNKQYKKVTNFINVYIYISIISDKNK